MKIAVICSKKGQSTAVEMFSNRIRLINNLYSDSLGPEDCSTSFWNFVNILGTKVNLEGWKHYRGDMRSPGFTYYSLWNNIEGIFIKQHNTERTSCIPCMPSSEQ